jgi:hypothetical protein
MHSKNSSWQCDLLLFDRRMLDLFCPSGQCLRPQSLIRRRRRKQYNLSTAWDEVNDIQKASKTYEAPTSSIQIP